MQNFSHGMQQALTIWLALLAAAVIAFVVMSFISHRGSGGPSWWSRLRKAIHDPDAAREKLAKAERSAKEIEELRRYCAEVAIADERATAMADRRRNEWEAAQRTQEAAWRAFEESEQDVHRLRRANAFRLTEDDPENRRRHLVRMVNAAHDRGEISAADLADALMHRNGWDPKAHPFAQQLMLRKAIRDRKFRAYQEASELERKTAKAADLAMAAKRSLDDEAFDAELRLRKATAVAPEQAAPSFRTATAGS
ncbi:hypothetical protein [Dactylosporangium sp. NPDC049140]|jgi:hypothetical protein|uniref:hypothetical protein n=1 Tax=Dactylosporangium sp. NPDC049140 TaxID=3155647 RepID=UPI0033FAD549